MNEYRGRNVLPARKITQYRLCENSNKQAEEYSAIYCIGGFPAGCSATWKLYLVCFAAPLKRLSFLELCTIRTQPWSHAWLAFSLPSAAFSPQQSRYHITCNLGALPCHSFLQFGKPLCLSPSPLPSSLLPATALLPPS